MSALPSPVHLFVYGTLRRLNEHSIHPLLAPATFVGLGTLPGELYDLGRYPGATMDLDAGSIIQGEIYHLHDPTMTLKRLDQYEGCAETDPTPHEYVRSRQQIDLVAGGSLAAWVYLYQWPLDPARQIASGNWFQREAP